MYDADDEDLWAQAVELTKLAAAIPDEVLKAAQDDPDIEGTVLKSGGAYRAPIYDGYDVVGFFTPRQEGEVWRLGPVFVMEGSRGKGLAAAAVREFMEGRKGRAEIDDGNEASQRLFEAAGFVREGDGEGWVKEASTERRLAAKEKKNADFKPGPASEIFHGSANKIGKFQPRQHYLADEPVVFGTPERSMAISHLARWSDDDFDQGRVGSGPLTMKEKRPGAFEEIYGGKKGYLYKLQPDGFEYSPKLMRSEQITKSAPGILGVEVIPDALKALEASDIRLVRMGHEKKGSALWSGFYSEIEKVADPSGGTPDPRDVKRALHQFAKRRGVDSSDAVVIAGGALYLHGLRPDMNDIDAIIPGMPKMLKGTQGGFDMDVGPGGDLPKSSLGYVEMDGLKVQSLPAALDFYKSLNRPKDQKWIKKLESMTKEARANHVLTRLRQRAPGVSAALITAIGAAAAAKNLALNKTYHAPLPGGAYAVLGPVGKGEDRKHVVKTVLSPEMKPPGQMLKGMPRTVGTMADWKPLSSSNLEASRYDADNKRLEVKFKGGGHFGYSDVPPAKAKGLAAAPSPGRYFHKEIKGTYDYEKVARAGFADELYKIAATVVTELLPHQQRVLDKLDRSGGVLVVHGLGSGKTFTSIAAGAESGLPLEVVVPASLQANYEKEVAKHTEGDLPRRVRSYEIASRDGINPASVVVVDEAHRLRNTGTKRYQAMAEPVQAAIKRLLLTGTPVYNAPSDLASLANLAAGSDVLPVTPEVFNRRFIRDVTVRPSLAQRLLGVSSGVTPRLQNREDLVRALVGHVDVHAHDQGDYPGRRDEVVEVPMSDRQQAVYKFLLNKAPVGMRAKIRSGLPPSKQEARSLNSFLAGVRQASGSPRPYVDEMTDEEEDANTPKIQRAAAALLAAREADPNFRGLVYSNYLGAGLEPYSRRLEVEGVPHSMFTGAVSKAKRAKMVEDYNAGETPVLLVSSSGGEGLDLKGTKLVQVLEPHFNNPKIEQVIGRGRRYGSHSHLPEDEREVLVQRFMSVLPERRGFFGGRYKDDALSTDQWLQRQAAMRDRLTAEFMSALQEASDESVKEAADSLFAGFADEYDRQEVDAMFEVEPLRNTGGGIEPRGGQPKRASAFWAELEAEVSAPSVESPARRPQ